MRTRCTRSNEPTGTLWAFPPFTETDAVHPESQATERTTAAAAGASTRISSNFVVLDRTATRRWRPVAVVAEMGTGGRGMVNTA